MISFGEGRTGFPLPSNKLVNGPVRIRRIPAPSFQALSDDIGWGCTFQPDRAYTAIDRQLQELLSIRLSLKCGINKDPTTRQEM